MNNAILAELLRATAAWIADMAGVTGMPIDYRLFPPEFWVDLIHDHVGGDW